MDIEELKIKLYAREGKNGVEKLLNTIFNVEEITETDILIGEGTGDGFAHPQTVYQIFDIGGLHNYKIVNGKMVERTQAEKDEENSKRPPIPLDPITRIEQALTEIDIQNIITEQTMTEQDIRLIEQDIRISELEGK